MNRAQTRAFLGHLCALFPHVAPHTIDPALVRVWHESALHDMPGDLAFEIADQLEAIWAIVTFPTPAAFNEIRREFRPMALGTADAVHSALLAARAAIRSADISPRTPEGAVA